MLPIIGKQIKHLALHLKQYIWRSQQKLDIDKDIDLCNLKVVTEHVLDTLKIGLAEFDEDTQSYCSKSVRYHQNQSWNIDKI